MGCTGTLAVALIFVVGTVFWKRDVKWNGFPEALDALQPGMTMEEARSVFPGNSLFAAEAADDFGERTWVADPEAVAVRVLHVEADDPEDGPLSREVSVSDRYGARNRGVASRRWFREEDESGWSGGVDVYFDEAGRLVGVHEYMQEAGNWRAGWGIRNDSRVFPREDDTFE